MTDHSELTRRADELKQQAEHEADVNVREQLLEMADRYEHLAASTSETQPPTLAALTDVFVKTN